MRDSLERLGSERASRIQFKIDCVMNLRFMKYDTSSSRPFYYGYIVYTWYREAHGLRFAFVKEFNIKFINGWSIDSVLT